MTRKKLSTGSLLTQLHPLPNTSQLQLVESRDAESTHVEGQMYTANRAHGRSGQSMNDKS
jgi:hypothetical protein